MVGDRLIDKQDSSLRFEEHLFETIGARPVY